MKKVINAITITAMLGFGALFLMPTKSQAVNIYKYKNCWFQANDRCGGSGGECGILTSCAEVNRKEQ